MKTFGELYGPAMEIQTEEEASTYFEELVTDLMSHIYKLSREEAEDMVLSNLGYYAGYYDHETRLQVERLFRCEHPIFGSAEDAEPSPNVALRLGISVHKKGQKLPD